MDQKKSKWKQKNGAAVGRMPSKIGRYQTIKTIGRGNFAVVKLAKHEITNTKVAIKIIDKCRIDEENLRKVYREVQILKSLRHPHVVKLYQVMETDSKLFLVTEFVNGGEVFEYLQKHSRMSEREARYVFRQIVAAVGYCHASGVVHRDLKAENLLFDSNHNIKLVDFGFSNFHQDGNLLQTWCGSPPYAAPELFLGQNYDGTKADAWSLGVVLYILVCGGFPFPSSSIAHLKDAVLEGQINIPFYVSVECSDLIRKLLVVDHRQRFGVRQIVQHRWFLAGEWNEQWESLFRLSLEPRISSAIHSLNHTCIFFMQQRGFSTDRVAESILEKRFDDDYGTYFLLYDKVYKENVGAFSQKNNTTNSLINSDCFIEAGELPRPSSRSCLTTGQVNVEPYLETPTISTADLVKLAQHSPDEDADESSDSECSFGDSSSPNMQNYLTHRRHTALGVHGQRLQVSHTSTASDHVGIVPSVPFPLVGKVAEMVKHKFHPNIYLRPPATYDQRVVNLPEQDSARRSSHGNANRRTLLTPIPLLGTLPCRSVGSSPMETFAPPIVENRNVDDLGASYLKFRGNYKRHSVHGSDERMASGGFASSEAYFQAPTPVNRQYSPLDSYGGGGRPIRGNPQAAFRQSATTRRSSDSTQLTPDMLRHLGKLYCTAATQRVKSENMRQLQQEFTQLRASTEHIQHQLLATNPSDVWRSPRSSPSGQSLHMIVEDDGGSSMFGYKKQCACSPSNNPTGSAMTNDYAINLMRSGGTRQDPLQPFVDVPFAGTPMDIVTERSTKQPHSAPSTPADPLMSFQRFASDLLSTNVLPQPINNSIGGMPQCVVGASPSNLDPYYYSYPLQQMTPPAVVGSSLYAAATPSVAMFVNPATATMTTGNKKNETVLSSRTISFISLQLRRVLNRMKIQYRDIAPYADQGSFGGGDDDSAGNSRRVSLESDDGTKVEIGVSPAENAYGLNRVDFRCVEGDYGRYQELCSEVLAGLNL